MRSFISQKEPGSPTKNSTFFKESNQSFLETNTPFFHAPNTIQRTIGDTNDLSYAPF